MKKRIKIEGMSCGHCVMAVKKELSKLEYDKLDVNIGFADIEYDEKKLSEERITEAIERAGYSVQNVDNI